MLKCKSILKLHHFFQEKGVGIKEYRLAVLVLCSVTLLGIVLVVTDNQTTKNYIEKSKYNEGTFEKELLVTWDTKLENMPITLSVPEQIYTTEEIKEFFNQAQKWINQNILNPHDTPECVQHKLNLVNEIPDTPIWVDWEWSPDDLLDYKGNINPEVVQEEGSELILTAILQYQEQCVLYKMSFELYPIKLSEEEVLISTVVNSVIEQNAKEKYSKKLELPTKVEGKKIVWKETFNFRGFYILALGIIGIFLIFMKKIEEHKKKQLMINKEMELEYPEIINTLVLYLGAGMTTKKAWEKIVSDYEKSNSYQPAYEQMKITQREISNGVLELEAYLRFAERCNLPSYQKFVLLLVQNIKRGTKGILNLLELESQNAFQERLNTARQSGEKAGTKMLLPMFLMLVVVLIMITIPAFMEIQI